MQLLCFMYINVMSIPCVKMKVVSKPMSRLLNLFLFLKLSLLLSLKEQLGIMGYNLLMIMEIHIGIFGRVRRLLPIVSWIFQKQC